MINIKVEESVDEGSLRKLLRELNKSHCLENKISCGIIHSHSPGLEEPKQKIHLVRSRLMIHLCRACFEEGINGPVAIICTGGLWKASQETIRETFLKDQISNLFASIFFQRRKGTFDKCEAELLEDIVLKETAVLPSRPMIFKETLSRNNLENIYYALSLFKLKFGRLPDNVFAVKSENMLNRLAKDYSWVLKSKFGNPSMNVTLLSPKDRILHKENVELIEKRKNSSFMRVISWILYGMFKRECFTKKRLRKMLNRGA